MTPKEKEKFALFKEHLGDFEHMLRHHTTIITLSADKLEADDLVAGCVQTISVTDDEAEMIIISGDKDMIQLLRHKGTTLMDPASGKERTLQDWGGDADLFMFEKCLRGDTGDNVQSAYPRVRKTRILKAYSDPYEQSNMMMETWFGADGTEFQVKKLFEENKLLMDLEAQPDDIQEIVIRTVVEGMANPGHFSFFHFMKFLGKYELKKVAENAENFTSMFSR